MSFPGANRDVGLRVFRTRDRPPPAPSGGPRGRSDVARIWSAGGDAIVDCPGAVQV